MSLSCRKWSQSGCFAVKPVPENNHVIACSDMLSELAAQRAGGGAILASRYGLARSSC